MQTQNFKFITIVATLTLFFTLSCTKEGAIGERGPEGPEGPAGPAGDGTGDGTGGLGAFFSEWKHYPEGATNHEFYIEAPQVTQEVIDNGLVVVYAKFNFHDNITIYQLPCATPWEASFEFNLDKPGEIRVSYPFSYEGGPPVTVEADYLSTMFRYVVVDPSQMLGGLATVRDIDFKNYDQISRKFNIKD